MSEAPEGRHKFTVESSFPEIDVAPPGLLLFNDALIPQLTLWATVMPRLRRSRWLVIFSFSNLALLASWRLSKLRPAALNRVYCFPSPTKSYRTSFKEFLKP
jgi:hypothetical protein